MRNYFQKRPSGAPLLTLSKLYDAHVGCVAPPPFPHLRQRIALFAVAEGWVLLDMICLVPVISATRFLRFHKTRQNTVCLKIIYNRSVPITLSLYGK